MKKLKYTFKTDTLFKMLFVKYPELLKELVFISAFDRTGVLQTAENACNQHY